MKVEGPNKTSGAKGAAKPGAKKTGDGAFDALIDEAGETEAPAPLARAAPVGALGALLALQGADGDATGENAKKAKRRGVDLLDHLEKIRIGLLTGELPRATLTQLSHAIATHREKNIDPRLAEILDDIDLRAQVELAKLEQ